MKNSRPNLLNARSKHPIIFFLRSLFWVSLWSAFFIPPLALIDLAAERLRGVSGAPDILVRPQRKYRTNFTSSSGVFVEKPSIRKRLWVSFDALPPDLIAAFLAAEDDVFFEHRGIYPKGIARAALANLQAGRMVQGGSTITQQLAKMHVGNERTLARKIEEALLARAIEQRFTKKEILESYLNRLYLGAGAYGVSEAAFRYFGVPVEELTLPQSALIAGLTVAPSRLNPLRHPEAALRRRRIVLSRMRKLTLIDEMTQKAATDAPLGLHPKHSKTSSIYAAPYLATEAKRRLRRLSIPSISAQSTPLVEMTANLVLQRQGLKEAKETARRLAKARRDPATVYSLKKNERSSFVEEGMREQLLLNAGRQYLGMITHLEPEHAEVRVGWSRVRVPLLLPEAEDPRHLSPPDIPSDFEVLKVGDLVRVIPQKRALPFEKVSGELLRQTTLQSSFAALELEGGGLRALVGGDDFEYTRFNRMTQACRQPGSVFKPLLYALALEDGFNLASILHDTPVHLPGRAGQRLWTPRNADNGYKGPMTLAQALITSRNAPAVRLIRRLHPSRLVSMAQRLGLRAYHLRSRDTLALGANCVRPLEMIQSYAPFAKDGEALEPHLIRSISSGDRLLFDQGSPAATAGPLDARLLRLFRRRGGRRVLSATVSFLMKHLLRSVVIRGTATKAQVPGLELAAKTGTTNAHDLWLIGFSHDLLSGIWVGDDLNRAPLGKGVYAGRNLGKPWSHFMTEALAGRPPGSLLDEPPEGLVFQRIDPITGLRVAKGEGGWRLPFLRGTQPIALAPSRIERDAMGAEQLEREF